jgi:hypothetical protein
MGKKGVAHRGLMGYPLKATHSRSIIMKKGLNRSRVFLLVLVMALIGICGCVAESYIEQSRAAQLLKLVSNVELGVTTRDEIQRATRGFTRYNAVNLFKDQPRSDKYDVFVFRNLGMAALRLAPMKVVSIQIDYKNNLAVEKSIHFAEEPNRGAVLAERIASVDPASSGDEYPVTHRKVFERGSSTDSTYMLSVRDDLSVPISRRNLDWNVDLSCMARLGGCGNFRGILKGAFEKADALRTNN